MIGLLILLLVLLIVAVAAKLIIDTFLPAGQVRVIAYLIVGLILLLMLLGGVQYGPPRWYVIP